MNKKKLQFLKACENVLLEKINSNINDFATEINSRITVLSDELSSLDFFLISKKNRRSIYIIISEGINTEKEQFYGIRFYIQKIDADGNKISDFSIKDYCAEMKIDIELAWFFIGNINFLIELKKYLAGVNNLLQTEEMKAILFGDHWIDIKPDFSPYR